jgi:hypothetical protein
VLAVVEHDELGLATKVGDQGQGHRLARLLTDPLGGGDLLGNAVGIADRG